LKITHSRRYQRTFELSLMILLKMFCDLSFSFCTLYNYNYYSTLNNRGSGLTKVLQKSNHSSVVKTTNVQKSLPNGFFLQKIVILQQDPNIYRHKDIHQYFISAMNLHLPFKKHTSGQLPDTKIPTVSESILNNCVNKLKVM